MSNKILLLTFHTPKNYGAVLQAYSLLKVLERKSENAQIIDYNTVQLQNSYPIIPKVHSVKGLIKSLLMGYTYPYKYVKHKKFNKFVNKNLNLTKRYCTTDELYSERWDKDTVFVCGSDQVFNPGRIIDEQKAFYLDFVPCSNYKFSYAASFGISEIPPEKSENVRAYLDKFNSISVRETTGVEIVKNLCDKKAVEVIDPTLLNDSEFWQKIEEPYKGISNGYLLYYRLLGTKASDNIAEKKAKENNLKLVTITDLYLKGLKSNKTLRNVGPEEFLWLYHHADFVVTDSFHGIAFSVIYKKPFVFSDENPMLNQRGLNLLKQLGIPQEVTFGATANGQINYKSVSDNLNKLRSKANDFINTSLKKSSEKEYLHED